MRRFCPLRLDATTLLAGSLGPLLELYPQEVTIQLACAHFIVCLTGAGDWPLACVSTQPVSHLTR